eukprot:559149-Amorphochlora_amoeboformis.AAC.1
MDLMRRFTEPLHLATVIFSTPGGIAEQICKNTRVDVVDVESALRQTLRNKLPRQSPAPENPSPSIAFMRVLKTAKSLRDKNDDK